MTTEPIEIQKLREYNDTYYSDQPLISDEEYDLLYAEAKRLYPNHSFFSEVGFSKDVEKDVKLEYILGSLEKRHYYGDKSIEDYSTGDDIDIWVAREDNGSGFVATHKLDGVSVLVTIENSKIFHAELRGDGEIGTNVTNKVRKIFSNRNSINNIEHVNRLVVRGEICLDEDPKSLGYKNRRNAVSGILHRDDDKHVEYLKIIFYELIDFKANQEWVKKFLDTTKLTNFLGKHEYHRLAVITYHFGINRTVKNLYYSSDLAKQPNFGKDLIHEIESYDRKEYDIDGMVLTPDLSSRENVKIPKNKVAFKAPSTIKDTIVKKVEWHVSRTGKLIPVVHFDPVEIGGATLVKATGFNYLFMNEYDIGVGRKIKIARSEEVIPYVIASKPTSKAKQYFQFLSYCPSCDRMTRMESVHLVCNNSECPAKVLKKITHYFISLGLEEFSEKMFQSLNVKTVFDIFNLKAEDIQKIEGWGKTSSEDFCQRISNTKNCYPEQLLIALDIPFLGKTFSKILVNKFDWNDLITGKISIDQLKQIEGISEKKAGYIYNGIKDNQNFIQQLYKAGVKVIMSKSTGKLNGKSFCITGKLSKTRDEIVKDIEDNGGMFTGMKKGVILVCNEESDSSKYSYAKKNGNQIITEEELYKMIGV